MKLALFVTERCNLDCAYCYLTKGTGEMTAATGRAAIEFGLRHRTGPLGVTFFGGEPLLRFDLIRELTATAREGDPDLHLCLTTNGTLLVPATLDYLHQHRFALYLSYHREYWDQPGVSPAELHRAYPRLLITRVVARANYRDLVRDVRRMLELGFTWIVAAFDYRGDWTDDELDGVFRQYRELLALYRERFLADRGFFLNLADDYILNGITPRRGAKPTCDLGCTEFAVAPDGHLYPCVRFVTNAGSDSPWCLGHVETGFNPNRERCVRQSYAPPARCDGCAFAGRCANWCGCVNWRQTGRLDEVPGIVCRHDRRLIPLVDEMANELYRANRNYFIARFYTRDRPAWEVNRSAL